MISIEGHRAAIGRFHRKFPSMCHISSFKNNAPLVSGNDVYIILLMCFISFLPVTLYLMLLSYVCVSVDLISLTLNKFMRENTKESNVSFIDNDWRYRDSFQHDSVHTRIKTDKLYSIFVQLLLT